ncbi:MAG: PH domain-containing protein, partial [Oscillospiraceae bacterium]|nr:PH domain-containing protein [Oscillospiraceae bacterium]
MKPKTTVNPHPFTVIENLGRVIVLLILPFLRGLALALLGKSLVSWLWGAWFDILIVLIVIAYAVVKWRRFTYFTTQNELFIVRGILIRRKFSVPFDKISTLSISSPFFLRPFKIVHLHIDTLAGSPSRSDVKLTLSLKEAERIASLRTLYLKDIPFSKKHYEPQFRYIGLLSVILSNGLTGVIFASVSISQLGSVVGDELQSRIFG